MVPVNPITSALQQMQAMANEATNPESLDSSALASSATSPVSFTELLQQSLAKVSASQASATGACVRTWRVERLAQFCDDRRREGRHYVSAITANPQQTRKRLYRHHADAVVVKRRPSGSLEFQSWAMPDRFAKGYYGLWAFSVAEINGL